MSWSMADFFMHLPERRDINAASLPAKNSVEAVTRRRSGRWKDGTAENQCPANVPEVNPRGQGPCGYGSAARRLPAFEARDAGGVTPFKYRRTSRLGRQAEAGPRRLLRRVRPCRPSRSLPSLITLKALGNYVPEGRKSRCRDTPYSKERANGRVDWR
jgi:hypothetical protein